MFRFVVWTCTTNQQQIVQLEFELKSADVHGSTTSTVGYACTLSMPWLHVKNYFEIILKLFQCFISHVTASETEIKLFQPLKEFQNNAGA